VIQDFQRRPEVDTRSERAFLERRIVDTEKAMGRLAAQLGSPTPITQELDVLDRGRELASQLLRQVRVRPLEEAVAAQLAWLDRLAQVQQAGGPAGEGREGADGAPKPAFERAALDKRLLSDLLKAWQGRHG
jgi:hypothetical protein